jgi:transposase
MKAAAAQIAFRYRPQDSATGVSRSTAKRLADVLGVDETQVIHLALHALATKHLPQYEADQGALNAAQIAQLKKSAPKAKGGTVRSSLFQLEPQEGP